MDAKSVKFTGTVRLHMVRLTPVTIRPTLVFTDNLGAEYIDIQDRFVSLGTSTVVFTCRAAPPGVSIADKSQHVDITCQVNCETVADANTLRDFIKQHTAGMFAGRPLPDISALQIVSS
jgi:hypothetical protein